MLRSNYAWSNKKTLPHVGLLQLLKSKFRIIIFYCLKIVNNQDKVSENKRASKTLLEGPLNVSTRTLEEKWQRNEYADVKMYDCELLFCLTVNVISSFTYKFSYKNL